MLCGRIHLFPCNCGLQGESKPNDKREALSSLPQASFNYINSIIGSGVIGIPYALHRAGFGLGLILLLIVAIITDYSLILMVYKIWHFKIHNGNILIIK